MASEGRLKPAEVDQEARRGQMPPPSVSAPLPASKQSTRESALDAENLRLRAENQALKQSLDQRAPAPYQHDLGAPESELTEALEELDFLRGEYQQTQRLLSEYKLKVASMLVQDETHSRAIIEHQELEAELASLRSANTTLMEAARMEQRTGREANKRAERLASELATSRRLQQSQERELLETQQQLTKLHQSYAREMTELNAALVEEQQSVLSARGALRAARTEIETISQRISDRVRAPEARVEKVSDGTTAGSEAELAGTSSETGISALRRRTNAPASEQTPTHRTATGRRF